MEAYYLLGHQGKKEEKISNLLRAVFILLFNIYLCIIKY